MKYDLQKRIFLNEKFCVFQNITLVQRAYRAKYKSKIAPGRNTILGIVDNYKNSGSVDRKRVTAKKNTVRTAELIKSIENLYLADNRISLRKIANVVPASISTIRNVARKDLNRKPYKVRRSFKLYKNDHEKRQNFVEFVKSRQMNIETSFICSDEAYFYLHGGHNIQNNRIWAEFQPNECHEEPLNDDKIMVWCAFSACKVYGPYFFKENVNWQNYLDCLKNYFWPKHKNLKNAAQFYFQQDGAPPHRKKEVQDWLKSKFGDRFLDSSIWPPRSPDLNPCDFSLWGTIKHKVYDPIPLTVEQLKENIIGEFDNFKKTNLNSIFLNMQKRLDLIEQEKGGHIEHLIK